MRVLGYILAFSSILLFSGCDDYLGNKTDLGFIDIPEFSNRDIAYVPIQPVLNNFTRPVDICVGFDELLYVVDEATSEVIAMDEAGRIIGRKTVPGAKSVAQDRRFDLLVLGTTDTVIVNGTQTDSISFATIYRLRMDFSGYSLNTARIVKKVVHPFYFKNSYSSSDKVVEFNRIGIIGDNQDPARNNRYYVSRSGISSSALNPDDAILWFGNDDALISTISVNTSSGLFNDYFEEPFGLTTFTQPPQITASITGDFIYASLDPSNALKVQYIEFNESEFGADFRPRILASGDTSKADGFINSPNKFKRPVDVTVSGDGTAFIFVVDAETDSLYQFVTTGYEGVLPPAATGITKYQKASFGGTGIGLTQFNEPMAVAYFNQIVYVADAGNGRILRYKLTLDFE